MRDSTLLMWCLICGITFGIDLTRPVVCCSLLRLLEGTLGAKVFSCAVFGVGQYFRPLRARKKKSGTQGSSK